MAENSNIEWTHHTFNPWIGCTKVSPACDNCYAEAWANRFEDAERWGPKALRRRTGQSTWVQPLKWNREAAKNGTRPRVFCASLADVFDNSVYVQPTWREDLWRLIRETQNLDWLLLTKRPQNIAKMLPPDWGDGYPNVWLGTTVENQTEADRRIPHLLSIPAVIHFLSCEPLLGPVSLRWLSAWPSEKIPALNPMGKSTDHLDGARRLDWVITGGESGPRFRHADPNWFRQLRDQCQEAGVAFLFKQWEGSSQKDIKQMGRELDGVVHDGYPEVKS